MDNLEQARRKAQEILSNAERTARNLILENKDSNTEDLAEAMNEITSKADKNRLLLDISRMDFICNRLNSIDLGLKSYIVSDEEVHKEIFSQIKAINDKLDGYPLIKSAVIGAIAFILLAVLGALVYMVIKK